MDAGECNEGCCPPEAPDCVCGRCGVLPPDQVVICAAEELLTCCANPDEPCNALDEGDGDGDGYGDGDGDGAVPECAASECPSVPVPLRNTLVFVSARLDDVGGDPDLTVLRIISKFAHAWMQVSATKGAAPLKPRTACVAAAGFCPPVR